MPKTENSVTHLSVRELAARWSVSENMVRRLVWKQEIPCTRLGRAIRISVKDAERYAAKRTNQWKAGGK